MNFNVNYIQLDIYDKILSCPKFNCYLILIGCLKKENLYWTFTDNECSVLQAFHLIH